MRAIVLFAFACSCAGGAPVASPTAPSSDTEAQVLSAAAAARRVLLRPCSDTCCADIPDFLAISERSPTLAPPRAELRRIATSAKDPLVRALAVTWLSTANDPADLDVMREIATRDDTFLWFRGNDVDGTRCPAIHWDITTLGQVALDGAGHILGRPFAVPEQLDEWRKRFPDPKTTPEYWRAHQDRLEELWAIDPFFYLRATLEGSSGETEWRSGFATVLPPSIADRDRRIVPALARHAEIFTQLSSSNWTEAARTNALAFGVRHFAELGLARFGDAWSKLLQDALDSNVDRPSLVPLSVLAARSGGGAKSLTRALERQAHVGDAPIFEELFETWPAELRTWVLSRDVLERVSTLERIVAIARPQRLSDVQRLAGALVATLSDRDLFQNLPRIMTVIVALDPSWTPPDENVLEDWEKQKVPGFLAPSLVATMDAIRKRASSW